MLDKPAIPLREAILAAQIDAAFGQHYLSVFNLDTNQKAWHAVCGQCGQLVTVTVKGEIHSSLAEQCETPIVPGT